MVSVDQISIGRPFDVRSAVTLTSAVAPESVAINGHGGESKKRTRNLPRWADVIRNGRVVAVQYSNRNFRYALLIGFGRPPSRMESFSGLCEHCTTGYALPGTPTGSTVTLDGTIAYFSPGSTAHDKAIVIATDIFGLPGGNNQLIADELAKRAGVDVWVPDLFGGAPPPISHERLVPYMSSEPAKPALRSSLWDKIKLYCLILNWIPFIIRNRGGVLDARIENFTKSLKREKKYEKIGALGFCLGGGIVITLAATDLFSTVVVAHPSPPGASLENAKKIKVPSSWICPEEDHRLNSFRNEAEAFFASRQDGPAYEFKDYKGTTHGFAARPNLAIPTVKDAFLESLQQTVAWFSRTL